MFNMSDERQVVEAGSKKQKQKTTDQRRKVSATKDNFCPEMQNADPLSQPVNLALVSIATIAAGKVNRPVLSP